MLGGLGWSVVTGISGTPPSKVKQSKNNRHSTHNNVYLEYSNLLHAPAEQYSGRTDNIIGNYFSYKAIISLSCYARFWKHFWTQVFTHNGGIPV